MSRENLPIYGREPWKSPGSNSGFVHIRHFPGVANPFSPLKRTQSRESVPSDGRSHFKPGLHLSPIKVRKIRTNSIAKDTFDHRQSIATLPDARVTGVTNDSDPTLAVFNGMSFEKENRCLQPAPSMPKLRTHKVAETSVGCFGSALNESSSDNSITPRPRRTQSLHQRVVTQVRKLSKSGKAKPSTMPSSSRPNLECFRDLKRPDPIRRPGSRRSQDSLRSEDDAHHKYPPSVRSNTLSTGISYPPSVVTSDTTLQSPTSQGFYPRYHPSASLHLSLSAYPSNDRLHADTAGTLWVAIEVAASVNVEDSANARQSTTCFGPSLAAGVVIDNSICSSPEFLESAANEVLRLARQMRGRGDHLSLYAADWEDDTRVDRDHQICPLQSPDIQRLKWRLRSLRKSSDDPSPHPDVVAALQQAVDELRTLDFHADIEVRTAERIVIIVAPCSDHLINQIPDLNEVQLHLICPGITSSPAPCPSGFGWFMNSVSSQSSPNGLSDLLTTSRFRSQLGRTYAVSLDLIAGTGATIEEVVGHVPDDLHPGEKRCLLVKLNVSRLIRERGREARQSTLTVSRAFNDVESMLDEVLHKVLAIRVIYKHFNFPANSTIEVKEDVFLRRSLALREPIRLGSMNEATAKKIAVCICAAFADPQQAMMKLDKVLHHAQLQVPARFLDDMRDELKRQINIDGERYLRSTFDLRHFAGDSAEKKCSKSPFELDSVRLRLRAYCHLTGQADAPSTDTSGASHDALTSPRTPSPPPPRPPPEFALACASDRGDPAKRIWRKLRQASRGKEAERGEEESLPEALEAVRRVALKNKRSIGADTLRSLRSLIAEIREPDEEE